MAEKNQPFILQRCEEDFDESFASNLHLFLDSGQQFEVNYGKYIEDHFKNHCPSSSTCFEIVWSVDNVLLYTLYACTLV